MHILMQSALLLMQDKGGIIKPIEVKLRPKGQALGFGVRHQDDKWDEERGRATGKLSVSLSLDVLASEIFKQEGSFLMIDWDQEIV
jgi:hypothetical protein